MKLFGGIMASIVHVACLKIPIDGSEPHHVKHCKKRFRCIFSRNKFTCITCTAANLYVLNFNSLWNEEKTRKQQHVIDQSA